MTEPLLKILARFNINEKPGFPLDGRAYLSAYNFKEAYNGGDLVYAVKRLRQVVASPELKATRNNPYNHTIALMWGERQPDGRVVDMIDFLLWSFNRWNENGELSALPVRDGKIIRPREDGSLPVTCEGGARDILAAEIQHRREYGSDFFRDYGPDVTQFGLKLDFDFSRPIGIVMLENAMKLSSYCPFVL